MNQHRTPMLGAIIVAAVLAILAACDMPKPDSNAVQAEQQERILAEGTAQTGMPAIKNFRERKTLKMIYELRDQEGLNTYTYILPEQSGKPVFFCASIGYAISDATGYTNPDKLMGMSGPSWLTMTQAEPNGLFTPDVSDAKWVLCIDPTTGKPAPIFIDARIAVSPFKLSQ